MESSTTTTTANKHDQKTKKTIDDLWNQMMLGHVPDEEIRRLMKIELKKRLNWGYKPTHQQQLSQLLDFAKSLRCMNIATEIDTLDSKLYETPKSFQQIMCGTTVKESSGLFEDESMTLDQAQIRMLDLYIEKAKIKDGHNILDLGCGHGALILYLAQKFQNCNITGVTNSLSQKEFIVEKCKKLGFSNVEILLADVTKLEMEDTFDRVFVVGLIEHMKNFELFLRKISEWMKADGLLFMEHYCHKSFAHQWEPIEEDDWLSKYIFPPGTVIIPSASFLLYFQDDVTVIDHWIFSGNHFARTNEEWLKGIDGNIEEVKEAFESFYGISQEEAVKLINFWRVFCLSGAEMFGYNNGEEWMISHLLFKKKMINF